MKLNYLFVDVCLNKLAENEALVVAENVVDKILQAGAKYEYEKYIKPKIKPFLIDNINNKQLHVNQMRNPPNDNGEADFKEW